MYPVTSLDRTVFPFEIDVIQTPCKLNAQVVETYQLEAPNENTTRLVNNLYKQLEPTIKTITRESLYRSLMLATACKDAQVMTDIWNLCALREPQHQIEDASKFGDWKKENGITGLFFKNDKHLLTHRVVIKPTEDSVELFLLFSKAMLQSGSMAAYKVGVRVVIPKADPGAPTAYLIGIKSSALEIIEQAGYLRNLFKKISGDQIFSEKGLAPQNYASVLYRGHDYHKVVVMQQHMCGDVFTFNEIQDVEGAEIFTIAIQSVRALIAMHRSGYAHRDVKSENLVYDNNLAVKLIDFDTAEKIESSGARGNCDGTTFMYLPPECIVRRFKKLPDEQDMMALDAFGLGNVLYEIFTRQMHPWASHLDSLKERQGDISELFLDGTYNQLIFDMATDEYENVCFPQVRPVVKGLLHPNPALRMKVIEASRMMNRIFLSMINKA